MTRPKPKEPHPWRLNLPFAAIAAAMLCIASPALSANTDALAKWSDTSATHVDNSAWGTFLEKYVVAGDNGEPNRVRYGEVSKRTANS
ncbi:MAG: hypothetical protein R3C60_13015 [Parvularculaceae bacterium]